jgi:hypothetical protein
MSGGRTTVEELGTSLQPSVTIKRPWGWVETTGLVVGMILTVVGGL